MSNEFAVCPYLYAKSVENSKTPLISDCCYSSKGKLFFRTFGVKPSFTSQSKFVILNKLILRGATVGDLRHSKVLKNMAQNVFGKTLLPGEKIDYCIQGKGQAEKLVFSTAVLAVTEKRCLYFEQDGSQSKTETLMYDKIVAISQNTGFEKKMGNYIGVTITTADGKDRKKSWLIKLRKFVDNWRI